MGITFQILALATLGLRPQSEFLGTTYDAQQSFAIDRNVPIVVCLEEVGCEHCVRRRRMLQRPDCSQNVLVVYVEVKDDAELPAKERLLANMRAAIYSSLLDNHTSLALLSPTGHLMQFITPAMSLEQTLSKESVQSFPQIGGLPRESEDAIKARVAVLKAAARAGLANYVGVLKEDEDPCSILLSLPSLRVLGSENETRLWERLLLDNNYYVQNASLAKILASQSEGLKLAVTIVSPHWHSHMLFVEDVPPGRDGDLVRLHENAISTLCQKLLKETSSTPSPLIAIAYRSSPWSSNWGKLSRYYQRKSIKLWTEEDVKQVLIALDLT